MTSKRKIIYTAPDTQTLHRVARKICEQAQLDADEAQIAGGLAKFLMQIAEFEVKRRNANNQEEFDNDSQ